MLDALKTFRFTIILIVFAINHLGFIINLNSVIVLALCNVQVRCILYQLYKHVFIVILLMALVAKCVQKQVVKNASLL